MSNTLHLAKPECAQALNMLVQFADGELGEQQSVWLDHHIKACTECAAALARFAEIDIELTGWGQSLKRKHPAPAEAREQLATRMGAVAARAWAIRWIPGAIAAIAAALAIAVIIPHNKTTRVSHKDVAFVDIPYLPPLDPKENRTIVRINIRVESLLALGYRIGAEPDAIVPADVLVGEDGQAHAVRMLSDIELEGRGN